jgi:hypothetical protein
MNSATTLMTSQNTKAWYIGGDLCAGGVTRRVERTVDRGLGQQQEERSDSVACIHIC